MIVYFLEISLQPGTKASGSKGVERRVLPARSLSVKIVFRQFSQNTFGTAAIVLVFGGQLFCVLYRVKTQLSSPTFQTCLLPVVTRIEASKHPTFAFCPCQPNHDRQVARELGSRLFEPNPTARIRVVVSDQKHSMKRHAQMLQQSQCTSGRSCVGFCRFLAEMTLHSNTAFFGQVFEAGPSQERAITVITAPCPQIHQCIRLQPVN